MINKEQARLQTEAMRDLAYEHVKHHLAGTVWEMSHGTNWRQDWEAAQQWDVLWRQLLVILEEPPPAVPPLGPETLEEMRQAYRR